MVNTIRRGCLPYSNDIETYENANARMDKITKILKSLRHKAEMSPALEELS